MFTRARNLMLVIRCANLAIASFFFLIAILPPNWGRGAWSGPPIEFHVTVRSVLLDTLAYAWFISAVFWFIRSSFEWLCCLVSFFAFIVVCAVILVGFMNPMPNKSPEPTAVGACRSAIAVHAASRRWLSFFR
jgi:hypothetical protein